MTMRVFINSVGLDAPDGASALDVVRLWDASEADALAAGERRLTDSRGLPAPIDAAAYGGAIFRVVAVRRAPADEGDDVVTG